MTTFFGILGWFAFLASLPLMLTAFITNSPNLGMTAMLAGAGGLMLVVLALATKGLFALFRL